MGKHLWVWRGWSGDQSPADQPSTTGWAAKPSAPQNTKASTEEPRESTSIVRAQIPRNGRADMEMVGYEHTFEAMHGGAEWSKRGERRGSGRRRRPSSLHAGAAVF